MHLSNAQLTSKGLWGFQGHNRSKVEQTSHPIQGVPFLLLLTMSVDASRKLNL